MKMSQALHDFLSCSVFQTQQVMDLAKQRLTAAGREFSMTAGGNLVSWGTREDAVVVVAHADTVWDVHGVKTPGLPQHWVRDVPEDIDVDERTELTIKDGIVSRGPSSSTGIGADDRAGIALAFETLDAGHTILITSAEEIGMVGTRILRGQEPDVFKRLQEHRFFLQLDRMGSKDFKCYDVGTDAFRTYVHNETGLTEPNRSSFTDIVTLCQDIPGVNISVGYNHEHTRHEILDLAMWEGTLALLRKWLYKPIPQFKLDTVHRGCSSFPPIQKSAEEGL